MGIVDKRNQILRAVARLMTQQRADRITTDQIAEAAGVGKGTIYRHFADKDDVFFQASMSGFDELCDLLARRVPRGEPFDQQLLTACEQISRFFSKRKNLFRMAHAQDNGAMWRRGRFGARWHEARKQLRQSLATIIERGVREGRVRDDLPPAVLATYLLGLLRVRARELNDMPCSARKMTAVVDLFCHGAAPMVRLEKEHA